MNMNLLPISFRKKLSTRKILRRWSVVWSLCLIGGVCTTLVSWIGHARVQSEFNALEREAGPLRKLAADNQKLTLEISSIQKRESILEDVSGIARPLSYLTLISQSARTANEQLIVHRLTLTEAEEAVARPAARGKPQAKPVKGPPAKKFIQVHLSGMATNDSSVATFVTALRESGVFQSVELKSSSSLPLPHGIARHYEVICKRPITGT